MPPTQMPRRFEAASLSRIRSPVTSRSNCAKDNSMLSVSLPMLVVVLKDWVTETNETRWAYADLSVEEPAGYGLIRWWRQTYDHVNDIVLALLPARKYRGRKGARRCRGVRSVCTVSRWQKAFTDDHRIARSVLHGR